MRMRYVIAWVLVCSSAFAGDFKTGRTYDAQGRRTGGYTEYNRPGRPVEKSYYDRGGKTLGKTIEPPAPRAKAAKPTFKPYVGPSSKSRAK